MDRYDGQGRAVVIGGGFCGLTTAHELLKRGLKVTLFEKESEVGGLAGSFEVNGTRLEKFYHHWFTSDQHITDLIHELGTDDQIITRPTRTGVFYANTVFRLSSPMDVLRFTPLDLVDRIRLGILALRVRRIHDWKKLETVSAAQWLREMSGEKVYDVVWKPLLCGKFGIYAEDVAAVWFWNKLKLRGGSRNGGGGEQLMYYRGGFAALAESLADAIRSLGGNIITNAAVTDLLVSDQTCIGVRSENDDYVSDMVITTTPLPVFAELIEKHVSADYVASLRRIKYLANICIVLELDRRLSETYWLNVNDPQFPFVGVIEHTNFEPAETYGGRHIVYLSKYLPESAELYQMSDEAALDYTLPHLQRMFPSFSRTWISAAHVWRAKHSQPVVEQRYGELVPSSVTPLRSLYLASMAQIYPEDRGTNYAVQAGKNIAAEASDKLTNRIG